MRISRIRIRNFRSIVDLDLPLDDYTALVGHNGAGKSSILYALHWFFRKREVIAEDARTGATDDITSVELEIEDCLAHASELLPGLVNEGRAMLQREFYPQSAS